MLTVMLEFRANHGAVLRRISHRFLTLPAVSQTVPRRSANGHRAEPPHARIFTAPPLDPGPGTWQHVPVGGRDGADHPSTQSRRPSCPLTVTQYVSLLTSRALAMSLAGESMSTSNIQINGVRFYSPSHGTHIQPERLYAPRAALGGRSDSFGCVHSGRPKWD